MCICDSVQSVAYRVSEIPRLCRVIRRRIVLLRSGWEDWGSCGSAEAEPLQSYGTSGTLAYITWLGGRGRPPPTWTVQISRRTRVCASMLAGEASAPHSSSRTVSSKDARLAPYCNRVARLRAGTRPGPSLAQKRRSFRMTTLKVLYRPG